MRSGLGKIAGGALLSVLGTVAVTSSTTAAEADFLGTWLLALDHRPAGSSYGTLEIERADGALRAFIDGGPVPVAIDGDRVELRFDWDNGGGIVSVSELTGRLEGGSMVGDVHLNGEATGSWRATPRARPPGLGEPPDPVDLAGVWRMLTDDGTGKDAFAMTPRAEQFQQAFDPTLDDPVLRCVSDGLVRVTGGPFAQEIIQEGGRITILYEDMHEIRRIYLDAAFPEDTDSLRSPLGYSIGHWEGSTLVVETRALSPALWHRAGGEPISEQARVTEYIYLGGDGNLHIELVLDDPVNYGRSPRRHTMLGPAPGYRFTYYACDPDAFYRSLHLEQQMDAYFDRSEYRR